MREAGLSYTELGPVGFIPGTPADQRDMLASFDLRALGSFNPIVLHAKPETIEPVVEGILDAFDTLGAKVMVIAADSGLTGYDVRPALDDDEWKQLIENLERITARAAERGVQACLHPHVGTTVETRSEVYRFLDDCEVPLCIDAGHLLVGGTDPVELVHAAADRIVHVHLKDVDLALMDSVRSSERTYTEAVRDGMYRVLGEGGIDLREIVRFLESRGYSGWYVPEQDRVLAAEPGEDGPLADIRASVEFLRSLG
ncbi:TIM barrel protein [Amycolatopsis sp. K13G38]|uniref:TIM barrel protein n=1 Tax=Amycolatopsis acididurans TaxID=2724524 RepID=A0ABX1J5E7_9PSEU|nr:sugar phosphate isomerase/epimerase [Amycolatopsis acididurans]NKQ55022.1 TIM barrel protein [Amycolatopsis acididurans]